MASCQRPGSPAGCAASGFIRRGRWMSSRRAGWRTETGAGSGFGAGPMMQLSCEVVHPARDGPHAAAPPLAGGDGGGRIRSRRRRDRRRAARPGELFSQDLRCEIRPRGGAYTEILEVLAELQSQSGRGLCCGGRYRRQELQRHGHAGRKAKNRGGERSLSKKNRPTASPPSFPALPLTSPGTDRPCRREPPPSDRRHPLPHRPPWTRPGTGSRSSTG